MARVLLMGAYGQANLGDEALLEVHLQQLRGRHDVTVATSDAADTRAAYGVPAVQTYGGDRAAARQAFLRCDAVVLGGGSLVKELRPPHPRYQVVKNVAVAALASRATGKGFAFSAMGAERLPTRLGRAYARAGLKASHLALFRDADSLRLAQALGAAHGQLVADPAYLLEAGSDARARATALVGGRPTVALNPMTSSEVENSADAVARSFAALAKRILAETDARILLTPFKVRGEDEDVTVSRAVLATLPADRAAMAPLDLRPSEMLALLGGCDAFVGMRHHGVLLAAQAGTPTLPVPYAAKTAALVKDLGMDAVPAKDLTPERLLQAYAAWAPRKREAQRSTAKPLAEARALARKNFDLLHAFLEARA